LACVAWCVSSWGCGVYFEWRALKASTRMRRANSLLRQRCFAAARLIHACTSRSNLTAKIGVSLRPAPVVFVLFMGQTVKQRATVFNKKSRTLLNAVLHLPALGEACNLFNSCGGREGRKGVAVKKEAKRVVRRRPVLAVTVDENVRKWIAERAEHDGSTLSRAANAILREAMIETDAYAAERKGGKQKARADA